MLTLSQAIRKGSKHLPELSIYNGAIFAYYYDQLLDYHWAAGSVLGSAYLGAMQDFNPRYNLLTELKADSVSPNPIMCMDWFKTYKHGFEARMKDKISNLHILDAKFPCPSPLVGYSKACTKYGYTDTLKFIIEHLEVEHGFTRVQIARLIEKIEKLEQQKGSEDGRKYRLSRKVRSR